MGSITGIVLAGGESKRMGFPKMLLEFDGMSMIEKVLCNIKMSHVNNIIVILGAHRDLLFDILEKYSLSICINDSYKDGMLSSVKCGFENLPFDCEAAMVFQGDQPFIGPEVINNVIDAYKLEGKGIVMPVHNGKRGHPLLIDKRYFKEVEFLSPDDGLRQLAGIFPDDVFEVESEDNGILKDFDTYSDYKKEINLN